VWHAASWGKPYKRSAIWGQKRRLKELILVGLALESLGFTSDEIAALLEAYYAREAEHGKP
jgi:hypothetical protein